MTDPGNRQLRARPMDIGDPHGGGVGHRYRGRRSLLWLIVPFALFVFALPFANRIDPVILGVPFLAFWVFIAVILSPLAIWLASRKDPLFAADEPEDTDVD
jgi:predicted MFS family arabinose efflux permease